MVGGFPDRENAIGEYDPQAGRLLAAIQAARVALHLHCKAKLEGK
jgi:hypothetical protein